MRVADRFQVVIVASGAGREDGVLRRRDQGGVQIGGIGGIAGLGRGRHIRLLAPVFRITGVSWVILPVIAAFHAPGQEPGNA